MWPYFDEILSFLDGEIPTDNSTYKTIENSTLIQTETTSIVPLIFPEDTETNFKFLRNQTLLEKLVNNSAKNVSKESENNAPLLFPNKNGTKYTFLSNSTILKKLVSSANRTEHKLDTEVEDLNDKKDVHSPVIDDVSTSTEDKENKAVVDVTSDPKMDAVLVQPDHDDDDVGDGGVRVNVTRELDLFSHDDHYHSHRGVPFVKDQWPAVLAGVFTLIAVCCYVGLLMWRKLLE